jgi:hypothetical protein
VFYAGGVGMPGKTRFIIPTVVVAATIGGWVGGDKIQDVKDAEVDTARTTLLVETQEAQAAARHLEEVKQGLGRACVVFIEEHLPGGQNFPPQSGIVDVLGIEDQPCTPEEANDIIVADGSYAQAASERLTAQNQLDLVESYANIFPPRAPALALGGLIYSGAACYLAEDSRKGEDTI